MFIIGFVPASVIGGSVGSFPAHACLQPVGPLARLSPLDIAVIAIYFVMVIWIGFYLKSRANTSEEFFMAGREMTAWIAGLLSYRSNFKPSPEWIKNAFHFGLFLQKVNLLKDQRTDEREGRFLIPDRKLVLASLTENAKGAIAYLISLPESRKRAVAPLRVVPFSGWSLVRVMRNPTKQTTAPKFRVQSQQSSLQPLNR